MILHIDSNTRELWVKHDLHCFHAHQAKRGIVSVFLLYSSCHTYSVTAGHNIEREAGKNPKKPSSTQHFYYKTIKVEPDSTRSLYRHKTITCAHTAKA